MITVIVKNLGARTTRTSRPHHPKVIICRDPNDPFIRQASHTFPDICSLIIGVVDGDIEAVFINPELFCDQLPSKFDRVCFEVIAKTEIAEHLKKRVVACGVAHVIKVVMLTACAYTFLRCSRTLVVARFYTGE